VISVERESRTLQNARKRLFLSRAEQIALWSVYQIFQDALRGTSLFNFDAACIQGIPLNSSRLPEIPHLHLLPAAIELLELEQQVAPAQQQAFQRSLADTLRTIASRYDYILLDCPPHLFRVTHAALIASLYTVIPYNPDFLSLSGLKILCKLLGSMDEKMQGVRPGFARNQIAAMILNRFEKRGKIWGQARTELEIQVKNLKNSGQVHPECILLDPPLRQSIHIAEASSEHKPVIIHAPQSLGAEDFSELTSNFIHHFENTL